MKKVIPAYKDFLLEDEATMTDDMNKLLQDINNAAKKRLKSIDKNLNTTGFSQLPGKNKTQDVFLTISVQNNSYLGTGNYAVSNVRNGVKISQTNWNNWSDSQISKFIQQQLNNLKSGQE